jgi:hypothetical protein
VHAHQEQTAKRPNTYKGFIMAKRTQNESENTENMNGESGENGETTKRTYTRRPGVSISRDKHQRLTFAKTGGENDDESGKVALRYDKRSGEFQAIDIRTFDLVAGGATRAEVIENTLVELGILEPTNGAE